MSPLLSPPRHQTSPACPPSSGSRFEDLCVSNYAIARESRAALVTSFGIFKYMAGYSITQFVSVMILYDIYSNLSDFQFVYIDLFLITTMAALFGFNRAYTGPLAPTPPISALFSILPVFSLLSQLAIAIGVQVRNPKVNLDFTLDRLRSFSTPRVSPGLCHSTTRMPAIRTLHWKELSTTPASSSKRPRSRFYKITVLHTTSVL